MRVALVGPELEENLGLRYMASALEQIGHEAEIVPFNSKSDIHPVQQRVIASAPEIAGLSMVFTNRAREFCLLAQALRDGGYRGHIVAGGHFASFNCERLLHDFPAFDSVGLGEGEGIICDLAEHSRELDRVAGLCYRNAAGSVTVNPFRGNPGDLDLLAFPKRTTFHDYFGKPIASVLSSRGCWRNCAFCSINAWYRKGGGKKFRVRSVENVVAEMTELYFRYGIRIFNFQDDNFFLADSTQALHRFESLRAGLQGEGVTGIAIAIKARPDSITSDSIRVLDDLGIFRVFLGVENASERGLNNLNRKCRVDQIAGALEILNGFDIHIAYNLLMFEPDTVLDDILINLRFMEKHVENPFNFCRAEAYAGTGLESKLLKEKRLLGDYFGFDYRIKDAHSEVFHQIANYAFFDRNFSDFGLHYFNMQVDFYFQLLRRFHPEVLTENLRGAVRNFIKKTNIDTYEVLCEIYDFVQATAANNHTAIRSFAGEMREYVDGRSEQLRVQGEEILRRLDGAYHRRERAQAREKPVAPRIGLPFLDCRILPFRGRDSLVDSESERSEVGWSDREELLGMGTTPIPYQTFKDLLARQKQEEGG